MSGPRALAAAALAVAVAAGCGDGDGGARGILATGGPTTSEVVTTAPAGQPRWPVRTAPGSAWTLTVTRDDGLASATASALHEGGLEPRALEAWQVTEVATGAIVAVGDAVRFDPAAVPALADLSGALLGGGEAGPPAPADMAGVAALVVAGPEGPTSILLGAGDVGVTLRATAAMPPGDLERLASEIAGAMGPG
jgi:hypothetical protein